MNEEYLKGLTKEELIKIIDDETTCTYQLKNNWNELKSYLEKQIIDSKAVSSQQYYFNTIYKLMQELEGNNESNN